jgi:uncharacterized protein involved in cysteine biosynthesis
MQLALKFGLIALVALALTALPGGGSALNLALTLLTIVFFTAIALLGYRLYREHSFELDTLNSRQRLVLYASIGLAFLTFTATNRLFDQGGVGVLLWMALLAACSYGVFWVWTQYRSYG